MRFEPEDTGPLGTAFAGEPRSTAEPIPTAVEADTAAGEKTEKQSTNRAQPASRNVPATKRNEDVGLESKRDTTNIRTSIREERPVTNAGVDSLTPSSVAAEAAQPSLVKREQKSIRPHRHDEKPALVPAPIPNISRQQQSHRATLNDQSTEQPEARREAFTGAAREHGRLQSTHRSAALTPAPDAAPVIHVSIGKVEVRAVTTPSPRPEPSRRSPMSIDEYSAKHLGRR